MEERRIGPEDTGGFRQYLIREERSEATVEKYLRDIGAFVTFLHGEGMTKEKIIAYKQHLIDSGYAVRSINSMLAAINSFLSYLGRSDLKVKAMKLQHQVFCPEERELTREEYERLCRTAARRHQERLCLILQTICSTGIRVSELQFITAEAVRSGRAEVSLKGKTRTVLLSRDICGKLLKYLSDHKIRDGCVFVTRNGKPVCRSNIWREMKSLCKEAQVDPRKVFPHNLRHLFARIFYGIEKDIVKLADVLGHSSVETTRIYVISTGSEHLNFLNRMRLVI